MPGPHDLFISYERGCADPVKRLAAALEKLGVACCTVKGGPARGTALPAELGGSKALLAWCSEEYFRSRACQRQLAAACIAREREPAGHPERVLLVNAVPGLKHVYPVRLRELIFAAAPGLPDAPELSELAEWLAEHCAALHGTFCELGALVQPGWVEPFDSVGAPAPVFEGRTRELWDIHCALHPALPAAAKNAAERVAVVSGAAGQGKSFLAREYAFRFGSAYPGGIFRLTADEAHAAVSLAELSENPPLKQQLTGLLHRLAPESDPSGMSVPALCEQLGETLARAGEPFLWIVDGLPDGLNGPAFRQWLAPDGGSGFGRTLATTRSRRYDSRAEAIHLPPLDQLSALRLLQRETTLANDDDREAVAWLAEDLGREARATAMAGALAERNPLGRRGPFAELAKAMERRGTEAADLAVRFPEEFPEGQEAAVAAVLLCALSAVGEAGRHLLCLAGELGDAALPLGLVADCFLASGLRVDDKKFVRGFAIILNEPAVEPVSAESARAQAEAGSADLEKLSLAERTDGGVRVHAIAARASAQVFAEPAMRAALHAAALRIIYAVAERCVAEKDWRALAPLAAHARALIGELRNRPIDPAEDPIDVKCRVRLALSLADLDTARGARPRAMAAYRDAAAYLVRAMNADPHNGSRQRDFAAVQERIGDLLAAQDDLAGALDRYRKSLGIRAYLAKQDPNGPERQRDLLRHYDKIGALQSSRGDLEGALQSYRAAHRIIEQLSCAVPPELEQRFELGASHERLAVHYARAGDNGAALAELDPALHIYEVLAEAHPERLDFLRAPSAIHSMMGDLLRVRADLSGALERYRTALAISEKLAAREPKSAAGQRELAACHHNLAQVLMRLEDPEGAIAHFRAFLTATETLAPEQWAGIARRRDRAMGYLQLGVALEQVEKQDEALHEYRKAGTLLEKLAAVTPHNEALRKDLAWVRERIEALTETENAVAAESESHGFGGLVERPPLRRKSPNSVPGP